MNKTIFAKRTKPDSSWVLLLILILVAATKTSWASSATWKAEPVNNAWGFAQNWTPEAFPNQYEDTATFEASNLTAITLVSRVGSIVFAPTASAYSMAVLPAGGFNIGGLGIVNNSGVTQKFEIRVNGTSRGRITFVGAADLGQLVEFTIRGSPTASRFGGYGEFYETASAGAATFITEGGTVSNAYGGILNFYESSSAGTGSFTTAGGTTFSAIGGAIQFNDTSSAGQGTFTTKGGAGTQGGGGSVTFLGQSTAANATFFNESGASSLGSHLYFWGASTAGAAHIVNRFGLTNEETPGETVFDETAGGGTSTIVNDGGRSTALGGRTQTTFRGNSNAANATITNRAGLTSFGAGGFTYFGSNSQGGSASVVNEGSAIANAGGGTLYLSRTTNDTVSAGSMVVTNQGASVAGGNPGRTTFSGVSASQATITNEGGLNGGNGGITEFISSATATAGNASITNKAPTSVASGGVTNFTAGSAGTAVITAEGSSVAGESAINFQNSATASDSSITVFGATSAGGMGARVQFSNFSTAGNAALTAKAGTLANAPGGRIIFANQAEGGTARALIEAGARLDLSGLTDSGMSIGSLGGLGDVFLGSKNLAVGGNNLTAQFSGVIRDGGLTAGTGGSLNKVGTAVFTLSGANLYTGTTTVEAGTLCISGSVVGNASVNAGATLCLGGGSVGASGRSVTVATNGTLSGFGTVNGTFTNNGLVAVDDPTTLTFTGAVTNNGTMRIRSGGTLNASGASSFTNNGTLDFMSGFAALPPNFSNGPAGVVLDSSLVRVKDITRSGSQITITIAGFTGHSYQLQRSASLVPASFQDVGSAQVGQTGGTLVFDVAFAGGSDFYRIKVD